MASSRILVSSLLLLFCLLNLEGCGNLLGGKSKKKAAMTTFFVHGDPLSLVDGTEKGKSFLTPANAATFDTFHFAGGTSFIEREPVAAPKTFAEVESENSTDVPDDAEGDAFELTRYAFTQKGPTRYEFAPLEGKEGYIYGFEVRDGVLNLVDIDSVAVTEQHYSLKADGKSFSFLASYTSPRIGKVLSAFYFASSEVTNPVLKASKDFAFLFDTIKIPWDGPIQVESCGTYSSNVQASILQSVNAWNADVAPTAGRRPVTFATRSTYAPFSDLNQNCIFLVRNFKLENSYDFYTAGVTIPVVNLATKRIVASDVFLFVDHPSVSRQLIAGGKSPVLLHEMGHFFGLGHEFKTDAAGAALHPSIMGYSRGTDVITDWDFEAMRDLYGESLGSVMP